MSTSRTWLPCIAVAGLLLLSACATDGVTVRSEKPQAATLDRAIADANAALAAGQTDKAQTILKSAATSYPADKTPWLQMAQMKFDRASYGEAIMNALEALQRDPNDKLANSIVAVSGLRLSTKALADLSQQNNLNGSLRSEAQDLAKLLRTSLGEDVLVPAANTRKAAPIPAPTQGKKGTTAAVPASKANPQTNNSDPFGGLK
ncbi:tetratricopeptide repeat protein [Duganella sp. PWIR1]